MANHTAAPATSLELYRRSRGLSRVDLAERSSISRETVARIERRNHRPHLETVQQLAKALDVPVEALIPTSERSGTGTESP